MTAKEYLQEKYEWHKKHWNEHEHVDDEFTASEMESYHQAKLKLLDIPIASNRRELLIAFFKHLRDKGEQNIGMTIEQFVDDFLSNYYTNLKN